MGIYPYIIGYLDDPFQEKTSPLNHWPPRRGGGPCGDFPRPAALASAVHSPVAAATLEGLPRTRGAVDASTEQGLLNVPFWVYWTSPSSSHYRPYT